MTAFDDVQDLQNTLIRKALNGSVFIAPQSTAALTTTSVFDATSGDIKALPAGYEDLGYMTDAGVSFARSITETPITSWQSVSPTRSDRTADTTTATILAQETKLATIGLYTGVDISGVTSDATNGVVQIDMPATPTNRYYRIAAIFADEVAGGEVVVVRYLPNAKVTDTAAQSYDKGDEVVWPVTVTAFVDDALGTAESFFFGGAGWKTLLTDMGIPPAS